jgi:hypothetical protein
MLNQNTSINKVNYSKEDDQFTQNKAHDHEKWMNPTLQW